MSHGRHLRFWEPYVLECLQLDALNPGAPRRNLWFISALHKPAISRGWVMNKTRATLSVNARTDVPICMELQGKQVALFG